MSKLPQLITDAKRDGWYDWIAEPDGQLHPNTERALLDGYWFDVQAAEWVQKFCVTLLSLPRAVGESLGKYELQSIQHYIPSYDPEEYTGTKPFAMMEMWHRRIIGQLYGWKDPTGKRRFKKAFITTAKKTGKTTTLAALPLVEMFRNQRPEKEIYVVATSEDQAGYLYKKTHAILKRSTHLAPLVRPMFSTLRLIHDPTSSVFAALANDPNSIQGIQPDLLILDELHAWQGRETYDALIYGDIRREESLRAVISTAGDDDKNVCYEEYELAKDLLDPGSSTYLPDVFGFIAEAGKDPITGKYSDWSWADEKSLIQANPTLLENPAPLAKMRQELDAVKASPGKKRNWIRYMCNRWVASVGDAWIDRNKWRACKTDLPTHEGEPVWLALDLAKVEDLVALAMCWWSNNKRVIDCRMRFWIPEEGIDEKAENWKLPQLHQWIEDGWIEKTPGYAIDAAVLRHAISGVMLDADGTAIRRRDPASIGERFIVKEMAFDRWRASDLVVTQLGQSDGINVVEHGQGYQSMSAPSKELEKRILNGTIRHDGNPVLDWMFGHCVVDIDPAENIKPNKKKSRHKIDGIVALVMAVGRITAGQNAPESNYKRRGVIVI